MNFSTVLFRIVPHSALPSQREVRRRDAGRRVRALTLPFEAEPARTILLAAHPRVDGSLFDEVARALGAKG